MTKIKTQHDTLLGLRETEQIVLMRDSGKSHTEIRNQKEEIIESQKESFMKDNLQNGKKYL